VLVVPALVALAVAWWTTPSRVRYKATSTLYVGSPVVDLNAVGAQGELLRLDRQIVTTARMVSSVPVARLAIASAGVGRSPEPVAGASEAHQIHGTQLLTIQVEDDDPRVAQRLANSLAGLVVRSPRTDAVPTPEGSLPVLPVSVFEAARLPTRPEPTQKQPNLAAACLAGLSIGVGMQLARRHLDLTLRSAEGAERAIALPVLASVPELGHSRLRLVSHWPLYVGATAAGGLVAGSSYLHLPKTFELALALSLPAFLLLWGPRSHRALGLCIAIASFFAATTVKIGQLNISDVFLLAAAAVLLLRRDPTRHPATVPRALFVGLGLLILGGIVGSLFEPAVSPFRNLHLEPPPLLFLPRRIGEIIRFGFGTVGVVLLTRACVLTRRQVERALMAYGLGATASVFWGLIQARDLNGRARGLTPHPVSFGWISAVAVLVGAGLLLSRQRTARFIGAVTVASGLTGIALSGTRSAVLLLLAGLVILQFGLRSARRTLAFALLGLVALSLSLLGAGGETRTRLSGDSSTAQSKYGRDLVREDSIVLAREHGLTGVGLRYLFPPHNLVLGVVCATGVIGCAGLVIVVLSLGRRFATTPRGDPMALAVLSAALGVYASCWVVNPGWDRWLWLPVALVFASPRPPDASDLAIDVTKRERAGSRAKAAVTEQG
jgi:capsular polysaccharide biosynthesis protein